MDTNLAAIFGSDALPAEMLAAIQEAFDKKVAEAQQRIREEAELSIREELSARYEHDKAGLVEAMDRMLTDVVKESESKKTKELAKITEARRKLDATLVETKKLYTKKLTEHVNISQTFILSELKKAVKSLAAERDALAEKHKKLESAFTKVKTKMVEQQAARLSKIDEFVVRRVEHELKDFETDKRALNEMRVKFIKESKARIKETQTRFVAESAKKVEQAITESLKREMTEIHADVERNRQNNFGRRIFEAMAAEYLTSYLAEGSEIRKLQQVIESKDQELASAKSQLNESHKAIESASRKEKLAEERANRSKILSELLGNLRGDKRSIMASMLESTKTEALRAQFDKLVPVVVENSSKAPVRAPAPKTASRIVEVTGDKSSRVFESVETDADEATNAEIGDIVRLAGVFK